MAGELQSSNTSLHALADRLTGCVVFGLAFIITGAHASIIPIPFRLILGILFTVVGLRIHGELLHKKPVRIILAVGLQLLLVFFSQTFANISGDLFFLVSLLILVLVLQPKSNSYTIIEILVGVSAIVTTVNMIGPIRILFSSISKEITGLLTAVIGYPIRLGSSYSAFPECMSLIIVSLLAVKNPLKRNEFFRKVVILVIWVSSVTFLPVFFHSQAFYRSASIIISMYLGLTLGVLFFVVGELKQSQSKKRYWRNQSPLLTLGVSVAVASFIIIGAQAFLPINRKLQDLDFYIVRRESINLDIPRSSQLGLRAGGMFGAFHEFLTGLGAEEVSTLNQLSDSLITDSSALLIMINTSPLDNPSEYNTIRSFVKNGGSLLVLGDHTGLFQLDRTYNELLSELGLRFNFDSAEPISGWAGSIQGSPLYWKYWKSSGHATDFGISIGASLAINSAWEPLLMSTFAFSDRGNRNYREGAFLGDRRLGLDEEVGDIVLAATRVYGKGRIVVFGDTSTFQTYSISEHHSFVYLVMNILLNKKGSIELFSHFLYLLLILVFSLVVINVKFESLDTYVLSLLSIGALFIYISSILLRCNTVTFNDKISYINLGNNNYASSSFAAFSSVVPLAYASHRAGFFPLILQTNTVPLIYNQDLPCLQIFPCPGNLTYKQQKSILRDAENGDTVILFIDKRAETSIPMILDILDVEFVGVEYGAVTPDNCSLNIQLSRCLSLNVSDSLKYELVGYVYDNIPFMVSCKIGKGKIIVLSDPQFFYSFNTESRDTYYEANVKFLENIMR